MEHRINLANHITRWLAASIYVSVFCASASLALSQDQTDEALQIEPARAVRGQLVFVRFSSQVHLVRVFRVDADRDQDASRSSNGYPQLVAIEEGAAYVFSSPTAGKFYVEAIRIAQERNKLEILDGSFEITNEFPPEPPTPPVPISVQPFPSPEGLRVIIVHETGAALPKEQASLLTSSVLREWLANNTVAEANAAGYRVWDDDYTDDQLANVPTVWKDAYKAAVQYLQQSGAKAVVLASSPKGGLKSPLPNSVDELLRRLQELK